ncbi:hypothetical protein PQF33_47770 [Dactylosporangium aurantiacum]|nr:hypothetical protein [Dactylosporangium aurantiacum]MDG6109823.1 hypothetical protein [Dactylosporangium aurantiacum]
MLFVGEPVRVGLHVHHLVAEPVVVPVDLVDDLLRAADEDRAACDRVLEGVEDRFDPDASEGLQAGVEDRPVRVDRVLRAFGDVQAGGAGADERGGRVVAVEGEPLAVVRDQLGVGLDRVGDVGGEQRVAVQGGQLDGGLAGGAAVPDADVRSRRPPDRLSRVA